ncbi:MAG: CDP-glycerol glycerophosphotransferase family protein [Firmicutes bacterium]|nr:CDP-glycerol glycerophosphotransferase family protein [Bacillota bacterium]
MSIKYSIVKIGIGALRALYAPMKLQKTRNKVVFISRQSEKPSVDLLKLRDYLEKNHPEVEVKLMVRMLEGHSKVGYAFHMISQMMNIASSKLVVLDGYCIAACILNHKPETKIIQMWHATAAIKNFGYQVINKPSGRSAEVAETMCMHRNYDYIIAPSEVTGEHFCQAFRADRDKLRFYCLPRIDDIMAEDSQLNEKIRKEYGLGDDKEVVVYVPTFRRNAVVETKPLIESLDPEKYVLVIKLHPLDETEVDTEGTDLRVIADRKYSSYEWLKAADRIITDYSALGVEAALVMKPLYYYVYDIDEYKEDVGLNVDPLVELPQMSSKDAGELAKMMERPYDFDALRAFRNRFVSVDTDNSTGKLGEFIHGIIKEIS